VFNNINSLNNIPVFKLENIGKNLLNIIIIVLIIILLLQRCGGGHSISDIVIKRDTVYVEHSGTVITKPQLVKTEPYAVPIDRWNTEYLPDTNYDKLLKQYESIVRELLAKNIQSDSIKIDSIGHVYVTDTVSKNLIVGRSTHYNLHYPIITNTIIVPEKKRNQLYIGGSVEGSQITPFDQLNLGLLLKTKSDKIFGISAGIDMNGQIQYGLSSYWKIKLHK